MWVSIKNIIPSVASRFDFDLKKQINKDEICFLWSKMVSQIFGKEYQDQFKPLYLRDRALFVRCPNSAWANELQMRQQEFLERLNQNFKMTRIERINFIV